MDSIFIYMQAPGLRDHESRIIQKLADCLDNGGDINQIGPNVETILLCAVDIGYKRVVEYALSRGASIAMKIVNNGNHCNALDLAAEKYRDGNYPFNIRLPIYNVLKERSLELYSPCGLNALHVDCALNMCNWSDESKLFKNAEVNAIISNESEIWPGLTPLLIAAKFEQQFTVRRLLELGADPFISDLDGNSPLHYLYQRDPYFYDERLFAPDVMNTFGTRTEFSHFHIACQQRAIVPEALDIVKRYLEQGISPDLPTQKGIVGLHIAAQTQDLDLMRLLLEYGADVDKEDSNGSTPIDHWLKCLRQQKTLDCICLFIETAGYNVRRCDVSILFNVLSYTFVECKKDFIECVLRLRALNEALVSENLMSMYLKFSNERFGGWNKTEYANRCSEELRALSNLGLRHVLDDAVVVKSDFENKLTFDFSSYPIYGSLLKIKTKRKLLEFREKERKIPQAAPKVKRLFQSLCHLPDLVAETILWYFSNKELDKFLGQQFNGA